MNYFESHGVMSEKYVRNNKQKEKNVDWDINYDGNQADIMMNLSKNGKRKHIYAKLDNKDLVELLHIPVMNTPLEERLTYDFFRRPQMKRNCLRHQHHRSKSLSSQKMDDYGSTTSTTTSTFSPSKSKSHKSKSHKSRSKSKSKTQKLRSSITTPTILKTEKPETMRFRLNPVSISPTSIP